MIELNRGQFIFGSNSAYIHHVLILVTLCTRMSKNGNRLIIDCILNVNYAYQFYWCQFCNNYYNHCEKSILEKSSLLQIFTHNGTEMSSHTVHTKTFCTPPPSIGLKFENQNIWMTTFSLYTEALLLKLWHIFTFFFFFFFFFLSAMMYNKCDVFVYGHKWKCNSTEVDSLFSFH